MRCAAGPCRFAAARATAPPTFTHPPSPPRAPRFPELYIVKNGYYTRCGFHNDPKLLCGCARECTNLNVDEEELTANGVCPPYQGDVYEQTCDDVYTDATLAAGTCTDPNLYPNPNPDPNLPFH